MGVVLGFFGMGKLQNVVVVGEIKGEEKPLKKLAEAFRDLAATIDENSPMQVASFSDACTLVSVLVGCLGFAFRTVEQDIFSKVSNLAEASKTIKTLPELIDADIKTNTVRKVGSHTRNLLRVNRGLRFLKLFSEEILATDRGEESMISAATKAYEQEFGAYHSLDILKVVEQIALPVTPTRSELKAMVNEDDDSAKIHLETYIASSEKVIKYVNCLFESRGLGIDW